MNKYYLDVNEEGQVVGWGTSPMSDNCIEIEMDENNPFFNSYGRYSYRDGNLIEDMSKVIEDAKKSKDRELNLACNNEIMKGFSHVIDGEEYYFSMDIEAQLNFQGTERLFSEGFIQEIMWTVTDVDGNYRRINIDNNIMNELTLRILEHKANSVAKYRDYLMPMVKKAKTLEEIDSIKWDEEWNYLPTGIALR